MDEPSFRQYQGNGRLRDRVAVVTGGASGMGAATSYLFSAEGARVAVHSGREAWSSAHGYPWGSELTDRQRCRESGRTDFMVTVAPLVIVGGAGSPVNPLATL